MELYHLKIYIDDLLHQAVGSKIVYILVGICGLISIKTLSELINDVK